MATAAAVLNWASVLADTRCIGHFIARGKSGVEGFDIQDRSIGLFATRPLAAQAIEAAVSLDEAHGA